MTAIRRGLCGIGFILIAALALCIAVAPNTAHQIERGHTEAAHIRNLYHGGLCEAKRVYFNVITGQIMVSCQIPDTSICGLLIWRVTENGGSTILTGDAYECTVHAIPCIKIAGIVARDNYIGWLEVPLDLRTAIRDAHGEP